MEGPGGGKGPFGMSDDSNQPPEESGEVRETLQGNVSLGNSDTEVCVCVFVLVQRRVCTYRDGVDGL